jgi:hypothetical protein
MVWVLANTTVKGRPTDDVTLVRRPPPALEREPVAKPAPAPIARPATDDLSTL